MKFCSSCGKSLVWRIPPNDDRERFVCAQCETVHYQNPRIIVGCLPVWDDQVLLCRRSIQPRRGYWTLPAGFMENGESTQEGAERETWEEARARVIDASLYSIFDLPHISQVYMFYRAALVAPDFGPTHESEEVALFSETGIPWSELAFPVVNFTLKRFFVDRLGGQFPVLNRTLRPEDWRHLAKDASRPAG